MHLYGGPHGQEVRDAWQGSNFLWHEMMAEKGFVIFVLDNRGTAGRGHNFETPIYHHFGSVELADQLAGVEVAFEAALCGSPRASGSGAGASAAT